METERCPATVADEVEPKFTVAAFHAVVDFSDGYFRFAHNDLEVPDQGLHCAVDLFFRRKYPFGNIGLESGLVRHGIQLVQRLADDGQTLPHLLCAHHEAIVGVAVLAHGDNEIEVLVAAVGVGHAHVVIHATSAQVGAGEAVSECFVSRERTAVDRAVHEDPVAHEHLLEFLETSGHFLEQGPNALPG